MTITAEDRQSAKTKMSPFGAQDDLTATLPNVLQNMLREFADRNDVPSEITMTERQARKICDHREIGSYTLDIEDRLTLEVSDYPFEAVYKDGLDIQDLRQITSNDNCSMPIVQLSPSYFDHCLGYSAQTDSNGNGRDVYVLVMKVNHQKVLIYDPLRFRETDGKEMETTEVPKQDFVNAWLGKWQITSTLWMRGTDQKRISQFDNE